MRPDGTLPELEDVDDAIDIPIRHLNDTAVAVAIAGKQPT
jgi:hypothetical protein